MQIVRVAGSLLLVLAALLALLYGLKRWGGFIRKPADQKNMEVLSKQSFGPRHHLMLVRIPGGREVLVGISPQNMNIMNIATTAQTSGESALPAERTESI